MDSSVWFFLSWSPVKPNALERFTRSMVRVPENLMKQLRREFPAYVFIKTVCRLEKVFMDRIL